MKMEATPFLEARTLLVRIADEFQNNYLTIEKYAFTNSLTVEQATRLIVLAQGVRDSKHPEE